MSNGGMGAGVRESSRAGGAEGAQERSRAAMPLCGRLTLSRPVAICQTPPGLPRVHPRPRPESRPPDGHPS